MPSGQYFRIKLIRSAGSVVIVQSDSRKTSRGTIVPVEPEEGGIFAESSRLTEILFQLRDSKSAGRRSKGGGGGRKRFRRSVPPSISFSSRRFHAFGPRNLNSNPRRSQRQGRFLLSNYQRHRYYPSAEPRIPPRLPSREGGVSRPGAVSKAVCTLAGE